MINNASIFLGLRYLQPKRSFVSIITIISVVGIMLGVGVLIVVISVMKGFELDFKKLLLGFEPHVLLVQSQYIEGDDASTRTKWQKVVPEILKQPGVVSASPFASGTIFVMTEHQSVGVEVYGMRPDGAEAMRTKLTKHLVPPFAGETPGNMDLEGDVIVINDRVARELGNLRVGDKVTVLAAHSMPEVIGKLSSAKKNMTEGDKVKLVDDINEITLQQTLTIAGILRADTTWERCYVPLNTAQELFGLQGNVHGIGIEITDPHNAEEFARSLRMNHVLPEDWTSNTWMARHQSRLAAIQNERVMMGFVLSFVVLVAAFSVLNTTLTVTVQKRREIGILTALGARVSQIVGVFMAQATVVALLGTLLGYLSGMAFLHYRNTIRDFLGDTMGIEIFPKDIYFLESIPAHTQPMDVFIVCSVSMVLCLAAAFLPAFFAARVDPAVALRD